MHERQRKKNRNNNFAEKKSENVRQTTEKNEAQKHKNGTIWHKPLLVIEAICAGDSRGDCQLLCFRAL